MKKILLIFGYGIIGVIIYFVISNVIDKLNIFLKNSSFIITIFLLFTLIFCVKKDYFKSILCYVLTLFFCLSLRKQVEISYNFKFYLIDWLELLSSNYIVFVNIVGNVFIFIPLVILIFLEKKEILKSGLYSFFVVISLELFQLITKSGIFDIVDIILNTIGIIIGIIVCFLINAIKEYKKSK